MKPRDAFGVVVRSIGLLILLSTLWYFVMMLNTIGFSFKLLLFEIVPVTLLGFWMLTGAPLIVDVAYLWDEESPTSARGSRRKRDADSDAADKAE